MADVLGGLLTGGLGGNSTSLILAKFNLKIFIEVNDPPLPPESGGGGGGVVVPVPRSDINTTYTIDDDPKKLVRISFKFGKSKEIEREYIISKNRSDKIVTVVNFINKTLASMSVVVSNFKQRVNKVTAQFKKKSD